MLNKSLSQTWMSHWHDQASRPMNRRELLRRSGVGFGGLAFASLMADWGRSNDSLKEHPLTVRPPHFPARAKRIIFLFMHGGPSQVDTFDYKPQLEKDDGKPVPFDKPRVVSSETGNLLKSPWKFRPYGDSGYYVSDLFPEIGKHVDELCFVNSVYGTNSRHGAALLELSTGSDTFIRPSMGSWLTYGLGTENQDLPGFITICPSLSHGGANNWGSAFLPAVYQGTRIGFAGLDSEKAKIPFIARKTPLEVQRREIDLLRTLHEQRVVEQGEDADLESRIASFELAFRMQNEAPLIQDLSEETEATLQAYGVHNPVTRNFAIQCLMARRFCERGVRFIQLSHSYKWDQHGDLLKAHARNALEVDQPIAALLTDLRQRGLLEDTIVWWGGEFGRTPVSQGGRDGRDHNPHAMTQWFCGGGFKEGFRYGESDEYGYYAVQNKVHFHDVHASLLHLMGLDHTKLTYRYAGRDFRLTDIHGEVVHDLFA